MPSPPVSPDQRILVTNVPKHFLKHRIIKSHFGKFGTITNVTINEDKRTCTVTFLKVEYADLAIKYGKQWKNYRLEIGIAPLTVPNTAPFFDPGFDMQNELNWIAEEDCVSTGNLLNTNQEMMEYKKISNSPKRDDSNEPQKKKPLLLAEETKDSQPKKTVNVKQEVKPRVNEEDFGEELLTKVASTLNSRLALLEERDKQLRIRLNRDSNIKTATAVKGLCPDMCPEKERILRDVRGMVAGYEAVDGTNMKMDHDKAVKDYTRSSADQEEPLPHELRPEPVLTMTTDYLITQIMTKMDNGEEDNFGNWYDFCWYRLRSIRKDIIQQQLCDMKTVEIVERCARFHICCFDRLWGSSKSIFDDTINSETLMNCLQSLMHMYEDLRKQNIFCPNEAEFKAYLILIKLNSGFLLSEYQQYSPALQKSSQVKDAVLIHTAYSNNMYSTYFSLMKKTTYLNCCLMQRFLAHLRTKALEIIVRAHCPPNKISRLPLNYIVNTLKFDAKQDCIHFCESFGLMLADDSYNFIVSRNDFFFPESLFIIRTPSSIVVRKRVSVAQAVVGINAQLPFYIPHQVHSSFNDDGTLKQGSLDASDQEEKLYRDIVERKLFIKKGTLNFSKHDPNIINEESNIAIPTSTKVLDEPTDSPQTTEPILVDIVSDDENDDYLNEDSNEEVEVVMEKPSNEDEEFKDQLVDESNTSSSSNLEQENESDIDSTEGSSSTLPSDSEELTPAFSLSVKSNFKPAELNIKFPKSPTSSSVNVFPNSPVSKLPFNNSTVSKSPNSKAPFSIAPLFKSPIFNSRIISSHIVKSPTVKSPIAKSPTTAPTTIAKSPTSPTSFSPSKKRKMTSPNSSVLQFCETPQIMPFKSPSKKERNIEEKICQTKLKKIRSSEKMKKVSIRKYALLWKKKVDKLKKITDKSLRDYLFYWGSPKQTSIPKYGIQERLHQKKKTSLVVLSILHSDIVDRLDPAMGKVGNFLVDTLAEAALKSVQLKGKIPQPSPVFWKLIIALPPSLKGSFTFPDKLKRWFKAAFYVDPNAKLGDVQYRLSSVGVPVFTSVHVLLGSKSFDEQCTNTSAALVIRAQDWESYEETQQRCDKLISVVDNKFPLAILTLGDKFESCSDLRYRYRLNYFFEALWNDTDLLIGTLIKLSQNTFFHDIKVDSLANIISLTSEKLFDSLHEDKFINDGLYDVLCEPNNVIRFYNELINKIEKELFACYEANFYGTACEFEQDIKKNHIEIVQFPNHYKDLNFKQLLKKHLIKAYLSEIKWPFVDSQDLLITFRKYCHNIGCDGILSKLIRTINPPDINDSEKPLQQYLELIPWLRIVEDLVKEIIKQDIFRFKVVYRENKFVDLIDSHWWMFSDLVIKS